MITGIGIDNVEISRIARALRQPRFAPKVLTKAELTRYENLASLSRRSEFLAGRWAAKEAFAKAYGTGISSKLDFLDLEIAQDSQGRPYFLQQPLDKGLAQLSISHSDLEAMAFVVLTKEE